MKRLIMCFLSTILLLANCLFTAMADDQEFGRLSDPELLPYIEDTLYDSLITGLEGKNYFVQNVEAIYLSDEYLETVAYNSRENVYFGYKLSDLENQFTGQKYIFTVNDKQETVAVPIEHYDDNTLNKIIKNVVVGTGVILVCVTVSAVSGGAGAPAVSMIFAVAAKTGSTAALSGVALAGVVSGAVVGYKTGDMNEALEAAAIGASEGYKWGAISGAISGGVLEGFALHGATLNGLTMNEAALIQQQTKLPLEFIKNFHSFDEFMIYQEAGLNAEKIGDVLAYSRVIDLDTVITDSYGKTMTNTQRILAGNSPVDPSTGIPYELHHIGQEPTSPLAILTKAEHMQGGHNKILHFREVSEVEHGAAWAEQVHEFWIAFLMNKGGAI